MRGLHTDVLDIEMIRAHTHGLADVLATSDPATPVPSCGDWTIADLAYHLYEVQAFWVHIIDQRPAGPEAYTPPDVPADLATALRSVAGRLIDVLASADLEDAAWSWSDDHTVGFTVRRQIHESMVHWCDGLLAAPADLGLPDFDPRLAADGVDELVDVMLTGIPDWATFLPSVQFVRLHAADTDDIWTMSLGEISGTSSQTGVTYDGLLAAERVADDIHPDLTIRGSALNLLLWMWGRVPVSALELVGDSEIADVVRETVTTATQ
ncbi:MAG: maleylpyruvate isomerase N-terminal domain-containing protein [Actinomycetota bacterium]